MSWDVFASKRTNEPLGSPAQVRAIFAKHLKNVDWSDSTNGIFFGDGFSFELWLGDQAPVKNIIFGVRGGGDPLPILVAIARAEGWSLMDCSSGEELDLDAPTRESWLGYQELVQQAEKDMERRGYRKVKPVKKKGKKNA
jgi:hypothetical protein